MNLTQNIILDASISKEEFLLNYPNIEDGYKYEWNGGKIERSSGSRQKECFIQDKLVRHFSKTVIFKKDGILVGNLYFEIGKNQIRKPDLSIYLGHQMPLMSKGVNQSPIWISEVINELDEVGVLNKKLKEYFKIGVQVVWYIYANTNQVYVYTSPEEVTICRGKTICSAKPALPDFEINATDLFAYKTKYQKK